MVKMFWSTDVYGYRWLPMFREQKVLPMPMLTDVLGPQMFTDTDGYRCLWFTDAYAGRMLMH